MKRIAYTITDSGMDGLAKLSIRQAFWNEVERDRFLKQDKNKAYLSKGEVIVDTDKAVMRAFNKLDGIDKLMIWDKWNA